METDACGRYLQGAFNICNKWLLADRGEKALTEGLGADWNETACGSCFTFRPGSRFRNADGQSFEYHDVCVLKTHTARPLTNGVASPKLEEPDEAPRMSSIGK